ncbi:MAG TPA: FAD-binding oxidoreductase, partial [Rhizobium sp.]|nr:FAD-binding oxidoreductase [Rhizobium sp.]
MIDQTHIRALKDILGDKGIVQEPDAMVAYQTGARYDEGLAGLVLRPATTEEVSAAVAYCVREGLSIVPQSGNTGLVSGSTPDATGGELVLSLDRMTRRFDLDLDNRSLHVDAG